jgi:hypothetical protein
MSKEITPEIGDAIGSAASTIEQALKLAATQEAELEEVRAKLAETAAQLDSIKAASAEYVQALKPEQLIGGMSVSAALSDENPVTILKMATTIINAAADAPESGSGIAKIANEVTATDPDGWGRIKTEGA